MVFFFNDTATTEIYTLSLHDALPISATAVAAAWTAYKPDFKRPLRLATPRPAREGWEERQAFSYETSPNERAVVAAIRATLPYSARNAIMGSTRSHRR